MSELREVTLEEMVGLYCETQESTEAELLARLQEIHRSKGDGLHGFVLFQCVMLDSSKLGNRVIMPWGPGCGTYKTLPSPGTILMPDGLPSSSSTPECWCKVGN